MDPIALIVSALAAGASAGTIEALRDDVKETAGRSGLDGAVMKASELGSVSGSQRRVAEFSWAQLRESARLNGATDLALTFADYLDARNRGARRYSQLTTQTAEFIAEMETVAQAPVSLISTGFDERGPIDRRHW